MNFQECDLGFTFENSNVCVFFGKSVCDLKSLQNKFRQFDFLQIHQTHSDIIVPASQDLQTADAHWTAERKKALLIRTADCIPAFFYLPKYRIVAGVHAGWRGVENKIIIKSIKRLAALKESQVDVEFWMGPHILQKSFEVDSEVMQRLVQSSYGCSESDISYLAGDKFFIDLKKITDSQLATLRNLNITRNELVFDTKSNLNFNSFRRDGIKSGRNLSFISLL